MGGVCSSLLGGAPVIDKKSLAEQEEINRNIEKDLLVEKKMKILKLLLLGPGDSGKSTTLKQIRIIHDQGFSDEERRQRRFIIYMNLIQGIVDVVRGIEALELAYQIPISEQYAIDIVAYHESQRQVETTELSEQVANAIARLLQEPAIQQVIARSTEVLMDDSSVYFLKNFDRIRNPDYLPSQDDILKSRVPTSGVVQFSFFIKNFTFKVFDVGGQKAQRRKWVHIFDDVHAVLFITSLSDYNQFLQEDGRTNRMKDAIDLFDQICNIEWFSNTAMILFLNKIDLFAEKIKLYNITVALKNYRGPQEYRPALDYITKKFKQVNKNVKRNIYTHETCATDTKAIQVVIDSVIDVVIQQTMSKVGIQ